MDLLSLLVPVLIIFIILAITFGGLYLVFYKRSTKERAFVRTGMGGELVILNGGASVIPLLHAFMEVNMNTQRIEVSKNEKHALITLDRVRVDVTAEFHIRVKADKDLVAIAARTLGSKTMTADGLRDQIEGFCEGALRSAAAEMEMTKLHENRQDFSLRVQENLKERLEQMGLELVSVTLTSMDQTDIEFFPENNALNVAGITYIKQQLADNEQRQNALQQDKEVAIAQKNFEASRKKNAIKKEQQENKLRREKEIRFAELDQKKKVKEQELKTDQEIEAYEVTKEIFIMEHGHKEETKRAITQREIAEIWTATDIAKAESAKAKEKVETAKQKEIAERGKTVELISANKEAERHRIIATGTADAEKIEANAAKARYAIEAAGKKALNEAANLLSNDQISLQIKQQIVNQLPSIIRESVKPIENIDGIKIMHVDGLNGRSSGGGNGQGGGGNGGGSLADSVVDSALRYKSQAPFVDAMLKEVGIDGGDIKTLTKNLQAEFSGEASSKSANSSSNDKGSSQEAGQGD